MSDGLSIKVLDCTLRDGGHVVNGVFGENVIKHVIKKLVEANVDIIEVGFLWKEYCGKDSARFLTIADVKRILPDNLGNSKISLMADSVNLDNLEDYDGTVEYIRLSFRRNQKQWAWDTYATLTRKGYKCFINPIYCNVYSDLEYLEMIQKVNELRPYGFSIVDTFGAMRLSDLSAKYYLVEKNLDKSIAVGVHLHENLGLSYSLAQHFINIHSLNRDIIIDGSLLGMGRVPGNLCIEQIMDHLNYNYGTDYNLSAAYDAIDDCIIPIKSKTSWGYTVPYALSAQAGIHRTYAEYLIQKWRLKTSDIQNILDKIVPEEAELFNLEYVESLYRDYLNVEYDDGEDEALLQKQLKNEKIVVIAPGKSLISVEKEILDLQSAGYKVISINFIPDFCSADIVFFTNIKRIEIDNRFIENRARIILTSNLFRYNQKYDYAFSFSKLANHNDNYSEDSTLMMIHLLSLLGHNEISIAGFDGFTQSQKNYYSGVYERVEMGEEKNREVTKILKECYRNLKLRFITKSVYENIWEGEG